MTTFFNDLSKHFIFWLLLLLPSYLLSVKLKAIHRGQQLQAYGLLTHAKVVEVETHRAYEDQYITYSALFEYKDQNGRLFRRNIKEMMTYYYEGQSVEFIYEENQPDLAIPNTFEMLYQEAIISICMILGITFMLGLFLYLAFF